jgi:hypothetical protein
MRLISAVSLLVTAAALIALLVVVAQRSDIPETRSGHQKQPVPVRVEQTVPPLKKR